VVEILENFQFDGITFHQAQFKGRKIRGLVLMIIFESSMYSRWRY
jgi:hypothetical protein